MTARNREKRQYVFEVDEKGISGKRGICVAGV
jgi:hypothetical protein